MAKIHDQGGGNFAFHCPGCKHDHSVSTVRETARVMPDGRVPLWTFNGDFDRPTFTPSINYVGFCHSVVTDGRIAYQNDCSHALAGQTVDIPEWG